MWPSSHWKVLLVPAIALLIVGAFWLGTRDNQTQVSPSPSPSLTPLPTVSPTPTPNLKSYKNDYLELLVPTDWTIKTVTNNAYALNITKDNYILYINTNTSQASGVKGGRFAEIGQGSPSADAVIKSWPADPCSPAVSTEVKGSKFYSQRADLYTAPSNNCTTPTDNTTVWYFSYLTDSSNRYFNYYVNEQNPALVITMSYQSSTVNAFPKKDDSTLIAMLDQMTAIANSLKILGR